MKRLYQLIAAVVVTFLIPVLASAPTFAASTCDVGFTGPDSQNNCTSIETYSCTVNNENSVTITNSNNQTVASGSVSGGSSSTSGSVSNSSGTTFTVSITNEGEVGVCSAAVIVPATETPPTVQPTATTPTPTTVKALPVTGGDLTLTIFATAAGIAAVVAGLSVAVVMIHRRLNAS